MHNKLVQFNKKTTNSFLYSIQINYFSSIFGFKFIELEESMPLIGDDVIICVGDVTLRICVAHTISI